MGHEEGIASAGPARDEAVQFLHGLGPGVCSCGENRVERPPLRGFADVHFQGGIAAAAPRTRADLVEVDVVSLPVHAGGARRGSAGRVEIPLSGTILERETGRVADTRFGGFVTHEYEHAALAE
ncbi:hypothetical protein ASA1KI_32280 [Opitutales bacterium ASA1]|nr:hypothetical protein ASA1KI_32280 [Opitutales bacterium ASA1]